MKKLPRIAVIGGTGKEGSGLAMRWARAGYEVIIGSRSAEKGARVAAELNARAGVDTIRGTDNVSAAQEGDVVVLTVPYSAHKVTLAQIKRAVQGKVFIDVTVPLKPPKVTVVHIPEGGSATQEAQAFLGENVKVVAAFQNISAAHLKDPEHPIDCDVLVCGDDKEAKAVAIALAQAAGMRGIDAGPLANAVVVEGLTPILIGINKRYKAKGAGIRITGLEGDEARAGED
ncbi:MAG: NADPH-dependent F420 reductase [Chloroflexi bacterium]|nr:NADPH-dependent F420 reductase [Chloroflexota bacterium]